MSIFVVIQEFEAQIIESRLDHIIGNSSGGESEEDNEVKLKELERILKEKTAALHLLTAQTQELEVSELNCNLALEMLSYFFM
jgi:hypothetical protein